MKLELIRDTFTKTTTLGKLFIDGKFECETLEDVDRRLEDGGKKIAGITAIPRGTYQVIIDYSNRFRKDMPRLLAVPQFTGIRIHSGNFHVDTDGCIIVGKLRINGNAIGYSRDAYRDLFAKLEKALEDHEDVFITVR